MSSSEDRATTVTSLGADCIDPEGEAVFGICSWYDFTIIFIGLITCVHYVKSDYRDVCNINWPS